MRRLCGRKGPVIRGPRAGTEPGSQCGRNCDGAPGILQGFTRRSSRLSWGNLPKSCLPGSPSPDSAQTTCWATDQGEGGAVRTLPASSPGATALGRPFLPSAPKREVLCSFLVCSGTLPKPLMEPGPRSDPSEVPHLCGSHLKEAGSRPRPLIIKDRAGDHAREGECSGAGAWRDLKVSLWAGAAFAYQGTHVPAPLFSRCP